jgi:hypothetical protein
VKNIKRKNFEIQYCWTNLMIADILTKALSYPLHERHNTSLADYTKYLNTSREGVLSDEKVSAITPPPSPDPSHERALTVSQIEAINQMNGRWNCEGKLTA